MYIPSAQSVLAAGLALIGSPTKGPRTIASGEVLDYAPGTCKDDSGRARCTPPFVVAKSRCYRFEWATEGALTHTTAEVRDAGSGEIVFYRDTDGEWTPESGELVYLDFKPKVPATGDQTVRYLVKTCE